jgi:predicted dehydrogenase
VLRDPSIDAVHICTPNVRHFDAARASVEAVKHVLCEKPLARTRAEAAALVELATKKGVRHATCYHLRCYPLVQQMRALCVSGELGETLVVQGAYSQDWLLYDTDLRSRAGEAPGESGLGPGQDGEHWGPGTVWREKPWNARDVSSGNSR